MAAEFHDGCWAVKFMIVIVLYISSFQIPEEFYTDYYIPVAKYTSVIFFVYLSLVMIIFAYRYNDLLVRNYEKDETMKTMKLWTLWMYENYGNYIKHENYDNYENFWKNGPFMSALTEVDFLFWFFVDAFFVFIFA